MLLKISALPYNFIPMASVVLKCQLELLGFPFASSPCQNKVDLRMSPGMHAVHPEHHTLVCRAQPDVWAKCSLQGFCTWPIHQYMKPESVELLHVKGNDRPWCQLQGHGKDCSPSWAGALSNRPGIRNPCQVNWPLIPALGSSDHASFELPKSYVMTVLLDSMHDLTHTISHNHSEGIYIKRALSVLKNNIKRAINPGKVTPTDLAKKIKSSKHNQFCRWM